MPNVNNKRLFVVFVIVIVLALGCWLVLFNFDAQAGQRRRVLFFVRVPKTGSEMTAMLLQWLQGANNFRHIRLENTVDHRLDLSGQMALGDSIHQLLSVTGDAAVSFDRHVYFTQLHLPAVTVGYLSVLRDPIDRLVSQFYYSRATPPPNLKLPPRARTRAPSTKHRYETFEECFHARDPECSFVTGRHYSLQIPYFCGHDEYCTELNNERALEQAKSNVQRHFLAVGVLENINCTLLVLEKRIKRFFHGVQDMYFNELLEPKKNKNNKRPRRLGANIQTALRHNLTMEYAFYEFINQRLKVQCRNDEN